MKNNLFISTLLLSSCLVNAGTMLAPGVELISETHEITGDSISGGIVEISSAYSLGDVSATTSYFNDRIDQNITANGSPAYSLGIQLYFARSQSEGI